MLGRWAMAGSFLLVSLVLSSCGSKSDGTLFSSSSIAGNWMLVGTVSNNSSVETATAENTSNLFVFDGSGVGNYVRFFYNSKDAITYTVPGPSDLTVTYFYNGNGSAQTNKIESFNGDEFVMLDNNPQQSTVSKRRYHRISDAQRDQLFSKYGIH